jgi:hypothetical protein
LIPKEWLEFDIASVARLQMVVEEVLVAILLEESESRVL